MRQVSQTLYGPGAGYPHSGDVPGNCLQAATASLLDLPLDAVPHFGLFAHWDTAMATWARPYGWAVVQQPAGAPSGESLVILWGGTDRGPVMHAVVGTPTGSLVWDPHPARTGLTTVRGYIEFVAMAAD